MGREERKKCIGFFMTEYTDFVGAEELIERTFGTASTASGRRFFREHEGGLHLSNNWACDAISYAKLAQDQYLDTTDIVDHNHKIDTEAKVAHFGGIDYGWVHFDPDGAVAHL
jgi:hypothetical protein